MKKTILRKTIQSILLETRANLAIRPVVKKWWEVAGQHGEIASNELEDLLEMPGSRKNFPKKGTYALGLKVPRAHKDKVFDGLTPETQEWVLKHWKTKEYFGNMISGVILGVVSSFGSGSNAIGQKHGKTEISLGTWNAEEETWVGGMSGYLTIRVDQARKVATRLRSFYQNPMSKSAVRPDVWTKFGHTDLKKQDSVLFHEFQHWFQESVMYADKRLSKPTKATRAGSYVRPKSRPAEDYTNPPKFISIILQQFVEGIDWNNPVMHPNLNYPMYKVTDQQSLLNTLLQRLYSPETVWPMTAWFESELFDKDIAIDFIENTMKLPLSDRGKSMIKQGGWNQFRADSLFDGKEELFGTYKYDQPIDFSEIRNFFNTLGNPVGIKIVPQSYYAKKKGAYTDKMKEGKFFANPTKKNIMEKISYIAFTKSSSWNKRSGFRTTPNGINWRRFQGQNTEIDSPTEWREYWFEFDAESRNYMAGVTMECIQNETAFQKDMLRSNEDKLADRLFFMVSRKLNRYNRIDRRIMDDKRTIKELQGMADRIADKIVEVVEQYDPMWYKDNLPVGYEKLNDLATMERIQSDFIQRSDRTFYSHFWGDYWKFVYDKTVGEI